MRILFFFFFSKQMHTGEKLLEKKHHKVSLHCTLCSRLHSGFERILIKHRSAVIGVMLTIWQTSTKVFKCQLNDLLVNN